MPTRLYAASPSRLLAWLDCPRRYRMTYLDRPRPQARPQRAHTSIGVATHNALRDYWDLAPADRSAGGRGPGSCAATGWTPASATRSSRPGGGRGWWPRSSRYLEGVDPHEAPLGTERTVSLRKTGTLALTGRIDRLDARGGQLRVVDYKTSRAAPTDDDARTSLPLALYAIAAARMFRATCTRVELHHVPTGSGGRAHPHPESLERKLAEAESIAADLRRADADFAERGPESTRFAPRTSALCTWCDFRAHCPEGQQVGPEKSSWAALEGENDSPVPPVDARPAAAAPRPALRRDRASAATGRQPRPDAP